MKVRNINGSSNNTCKCTSWLKHWGNFSGKPVPLFCSESTCMEKPEVGAHVQKDTASDSNWYIIPLCKKHNNNGESLNILDTTKFVSANVSETCGK